jgi:hypothetical protein
MVSFMAERDNGDMAEESLFGFLPYLVKNISGSWGDIRRALNDYQISWAGFEKVDRKKYPNAQYHTFVNIDGIDSDRDNINYVDTKSSQQSEPYAKKHPIEKMSDSPTEEEDEDYKEREIDEENHDEEISSLFQDAIVKLEEIKEHTNQQKKQIVVELAKDLEGKIPTDTICMEIVTQLRGQVSGGFVRECLDEKYKQKHRVKNARKQKKQDYFEEKEAIYNLAEVTTLNSEPDNGKIILVGAHGQEVVQRERENNDKPSSGMDNDDDSTEDKTEPSSPNLPYQKEQEQQSGPKDESVDLKECPGCRELYHENIELKEVIEKLNQFTPADKMKNANDTSNDVKTVNKILVFEFCKPYGEVSEYLGSFSQFDGSADVWFSGKIDTGTGMVVSSGYGRIMQQHQGQGRLTSEGIYDDNMEEVVG